jgi:hypothetical protein
MTDPGPGTLEEAEGVAFIGGELVAKIQLHDERVQEIIEVPIVGGAPGLKPGVVRGSLFVWFTAFETDSATRTAADLRERLRVLAGREQRVADITVDIELDDGTEIPGCRVGGYFGQLAGTPFGSEWFSLEQPLLGRGRS